MARSKPKIGWTSWREVDLFQFEAKTRTQLERLVPVLLVNKLETLSREFIAWHELEKDQPSIGEVKEQLKRGVTASKKGEDDWKLWQARCDSRTRQLIKAKAYFKPNAAFADLAKALEADLEAKRGPRHQWSLREFFVTVARLLKTHGLKVTAYNPSANNSAVKKPRSRGGSCYAEVMSILVKATSCQVEDLNEYVRDAVKAIKQ